MSWPLTRTDDEAYLYLSRQPCERCGEAGLERLVESSAAEVDGERLRRFVMECGNCGNRREVTFLMPAAQPSRVDGREHFGDGQSELLDPGEWLEFADGIVTAVPADLAGLPAAELAELRADVDVARAAVEEARKFVTPGEDAVSPFAFWTERGHLFHLRNEWRFDREHLDGYLADVVALIDRIDDAAEVGGA